MAITLAQPLGTDVYNIEVFNNNAKIIETAVNEQETDINNLAIQLSGKYNCYFSTPSLDTVLLDGIYYLKSKPAVATYPDGISDENNIVISLITNTGANLQTLLTSDAKIYQRTVSGSNTLTDWVTTTTAVVDNLVSNSVKDPLSANQGRILNETKLQVDYPSSLNLDQATTGLFICDGTATTGNIPANTQISSTNATNNHYVLECFGKTQDTSVLQRLSDVTTSTVVYRFGSKNIEGNWVWASWQVLGTSGGTTEAKLQIVEF
nr:tail protein [uncultured phage]CAI9752143.1 tail protein [uncultured phage]